MPNLSEPWVIGTVGNAVQRRVTVDRATSKIPAGAVLTKAWLTVKDDVGDADPGLFQKEITTTDAPGTGQIENDGTGNVDPVLRFDLLLADTKTIGLVPRLFSIRMIAGTDGPFTAENADVWCSKPEVTAKAS